MNKKLETIIICLLCFSIPFYIGMYIDIMLEYNLQPLLMFYGGMLYKSYLNSCGIKW